VLGGTQMQFEIGRTYEGFEFLDMLGSAKRVLAYRVRNVLAQRMELLRILPEIGGDPERRERFLREIKVRARLIHPNIVMFYHAGELEDRLIMTTELVEGPTLAERLEQGPMPWQEATAMMSQVLRALDCAHANGIVHREVAPVNIILASDQTVKLGGFGLARGITDTQLTLAGGFMGETKYMPPEQVKGIDLDGRSDIYSAGAVLYEAVTGSSPFGAKNQFDLMLAHVTTMPEHPSKLRPEIPADLDRMIMTALAKEPSERFQHAEEFRAALESLTGSHQAPGLPTPRLDHPAETPVTGAAKTPPRPAPQVAITPGNKSAIPSSPSSGPQPAPASHKPSLTVPSLPLIAAQEQAGSSLWGPREVMVAGVFVLLIATIAFLAFLTMSRL
jgi:eukaryotic-like serine/threonine-protein kinase